MTSRKGKTTTTRERSGPAATSNAEGSNARKTAAAAAKDGAGKKAGSAKRGAQVKRVQKTADGHHVLIDGRRWRATDPNIPEERRQQLVNELMRARRDVGSALRAGDAEAEGEARRRVHECKVALGERGAKWWEGKK
ncbi:MAG TPA: hypothetical protein VK363_10710 [Pyrinomonadaceae bacterium]|nr:hypothetical protein [Pyrinomonadaceae bacterium]